MAASSRSADSTALSYSAGLGFKFWPVNQLSWLRWFSSVPLGKWWDSTWNQATIASATASHIHYSLHFVSQDGDVIGHYERCRPLYGEQPATSNGKHKYLPGCKNCTCQTVWTAMKFSKGSSFSLRKIKRKLKLLCLSPSNQPHRKASFLWG